MATSQTSSVSGASQPALATFAISKPNQYTLRGDGISVTWLPATAGSLANFTFRDAELSREFTGDQISAVDSVMGTVVSVTLDIVANSQSSSFSILIPAVNLPNQIGESTVIHTEGIRTTHRLSVGPIFPLGQLDTWVVTRLTGTASISSIPGPTGA